MKRFLSGILVLLVLVMLLFVPAKAAADDGCILNVSGTIGIVVCAGEPVANLPLPTVTVRGPEVTDIVKVPGPTVTVRPPQATVTRTAFVQEPRETIYFPGPTTTATKTVETPVPTTMTDQITVTETTGQNPVRDGTVSQEDGDTFEFPSLSLSPTEAVGIGLLSLLALVGLILLAMYGGYILGYKDSEQEDSNFMRALRDSMLVRGKHS